MPFEKDPLPDAQVALIRAWIAQGAMWPDDGPMAAATAPEEDLPQHWAYRRPVRPTAPAVAHKAWVRNPIDQFVAARLEKEGLEPSPEASKEALIRRVSLDLVGPAAVACRRSTPSLPTPPPTPTSASSIASWPRRTTASAGRDPGSISPATPTATGTRRTTFERCGSTATG